MKPKEIREKTQKEVSALKKELSLELFHLKMKKASGQLDKMHRLKEVRRNLARLYTINRVSNGTN